MGGTLKQDLKSRISVVIPTYNYAHYLPEAIESVLAQNLTPLEIVIADDGSTDDTRDVVGRYASVAHLRYIPFPHRGVYALRQAVLAEIQGEWFVNLDADNKLAPDFLEQMELVIQQHERDKWFAFAFPDMELFGDSAGRVARPDFDVQRLKAGNYIDMNSAIRTAAARRFGFDPAFNSGQGDYDFFITLVKRGYHGKRVPEATLHYRVHEDSLSRTASRQRRQRQIMRRIVRKHTDFFNAGEVRTAIRAADNRMLVALISDRSPSAGVTQRVRDWLCFARVGWKHAEFRKQTAYTLMPSFFFRQTEAPCDCFYLFRDTPARRAMIRHVLNGEDAGLASEQLFGIDDKIRKGCSVDCNLRLPRDHSWKDTFYGWLEHCYAPRTGVGLGDISAVKSHRWQMERARVVLSTTGNTGLPALREKAGGHLKSKFVYVSIGLPERMMALQQRCPSLAEKYRQRFMAADRLVAYGHEEAEWLRQWLGKSVEVRFVPFGVHVQKWTPIHKDTEPEYDVLSIGNDFKRDFELLRHYALQHPDVRICLIAGKAVAGTLSGVPMNVQLEVDVPVEHVRNRIAGARLVVLPVKENTYSGATTTLLQCMSMGKAAAVSRVGAIREGYGFQDKMNLCWMEPGDQDDLNAVVNALLEDHSMCERLGTAARRHVEASLHWDRYVAAMQACTAEWDTEGGESI